MSKNSNKVISIQEWTDQFATHMASEVYKLVNPVGLNRDSKIKRDIFNMFIARLVGLAVYDSLSGAPKSLTKEQIYAEVMNNFAGLKSGMQDAVAGGFSGAMNAYSGNKVEYYCEIGVIPEPLNKEPC